tara:strand:+ start:259 stop:942 length:684 start_codon:yes stop_codon:yes gene_type:complete
MKVIILAGGFGSRISEYTKLIPKPMVKILKVPIIVRIINHYIKYGFNEFIIAAGYKSNIIKDYFKKNLRNINVTVINTGKKTMTGGRIKKLSKHLKHTFMLTYGDGLSNVNLKKLFKHHKKQKKLVTVTAVRPPARFGELKIKGTNVYKFKEKVPMTEGWINGGFFVMEPEFIKFIKSDKSILEQQPLEKACKLGKLTAFKHHGFWQCMDTKRDRDHLEKIIKKINF